MRIKKLNESNNDEIILYRGVGNNIHQTDTHSGGRFYADCPDDASEFGDIIQVVKLDKSASILTGYDSSYSFCHRNGLIDKSYSILREISNGKYSTLREFVETGYDDTYDNWSSRIYQCVANKELSATGYDGAEWTWEDDLVPHQYQIWNSDVITRCGTLRVVWENGKETFVKDMIENKSVVVGEKMKFRLYEDTGVDEFKNFEERIFDIAENLVSKIESELFDYGFEIDLVTDYEDYDDNFVGMFLASEQDNASVFPIVVNPKVIYNYAKRNGYKNDHDFLVWAVKSTLWHEVGHGIVSYLSDVYDFSWDEEEVVEEFARIMCDTGNLSGELIDALNEYEQSCEEDNNNNNLNEDLSLWDMEEELIETFWNLSEDELMSYCPSNINTDGGAIWVRPNGQIINLDLHQSFGDEMFWYFCREYLKGKDTEYTEDDFALEDLHEYNDHLVNDYGWVKFNYGDTMYEDRCYVVLPPKMTSKQFIVFEELLEDCTANELLVVPISSTRHRQYYKLNELSPSDIIKKIRRFFVSGVLAERINKRPR